MNPVLRENLEVLFGERHVLTMYFYLLVVLAPVEFGSLYTQSLGEQMWRGPGTLFKVCASVALVLSVYFVLRIANQEYAAGRFKPLAHWLQDGRPIGVVARGRTASLVVHVVSLLLLSAPLLVWAAAISHTPLSGLAAALALIPFYALCYGVWGLVTSVLWENAKESQTREFAIRIFIVVVVVAALAVYLPLNPIVYLFALLGRQDAAPVSIAGVSWSADTLHFAFHLALGGAGLAAHRWALKRARERGRR